MQQKQAPIIESVAVDKGVLCSHISDEWWRRRHPSLLLRYGDATGHARMNTKSSVAVDLESVVFFLSVMDGGGGFLSDILTCHFAMVMLLGMFVLILWNITELLKDCLKDNGLMDDNHLITNPQQIYNNGWEWIQNQQKLLVLSMF